MLRTSALRKCAVISILLALIVSSFPTATAFAGNATLEDKWDQLLTSYDNQTIRHDSVHQAVSHWMYTEKRLSASNKAEVQKHLVICNAAIHNAGVIVAQHAGFDAKGNLVNRAQAVKSIKDLNYWLQKHAGSVRGLHHHISF